VAYNNNNIWTSRWSRDPLVEWKRNYSSFAFEQNYVLVKPTILADGRIVNATFVRMTHLRLCCPRKSKGD